MGRRSVYWDMPDYSPEEILEPIIMPNRFYPCDECGKNKLLLPNMAQIRGFVLIIKTVDMLRITTVITAPTKTNTRSDVIKSITTFI